MSNCAHLLTFRSVVADNLQGQLLLSNSFPNFRKYRHKNYH